MIMTKYKKRTKPEYKELTGKETLYIAIVVCLACVIGTILEHLVF